MKAQKGFSLLEIIIALAIVAAIGVAGFFALKNVRNSDSGGSSNSSLPTCTFKGYKATAVRSSADGAVTSGPTDIKYVKYILNHTSDDQRFVYIVNNTDAEIPVYAPADGALVYVVHKHGSNWTLPDGSGGRPADYDITFTIDCRDFWRVNHIINPIESIKAAEPTGIVNEIGPDNPPTDEMGKPKSVVTVKAGQLIGYTAVPLYTQWDIGYFKNDNATCIFNELTKDKQAWLDLISPEMGINAGPVPGTECTGQTGSL